MNLLLPDPLRLALLLLVAGLILVPLSALAESPEGKGLAIIQEADKRNTGWGDSRVEMQMILRNKQGEESKRMIRSRAMEVTSDGDKSMIVFDEPKDVKGTALLTFSHKVADDDRWLFLPAVKRVKRIASNNKSGPFMGSEFAFEDLGSQEIEKYKDYKWTKDEAVNGVDCQVVERVPVDKNSGYTKQVVWLDKAEYRVQKVEFYDRKNSLLKTLTISDYARYLSDRYWRPARMDMINHQTGKSTTLLFSNYAFGNGFSDRDFDQNSLQAAR